MLLAGTEDGVYEVTGIDGSRAADVERTLDAGAVTRLEQVPGYGGVFAATEQGLYHSNDGTEWLAVDAPPETVYALGGSPDGRLYVGTRPAHLYVARPGNVDVADGSVTWEELDAFQELPSRDEWRLPRHENLAQVRDVHVPPSEPDRVIVGVEVGGVHMSDDGGATWSERREGVHDDVHELLAVSSTEFVAATGFGLFRTADAGRSWRRLDHGHEQRYFRSALAADGDVYAGGALAHTATWEDDDAAPALFVSRDGEELETVSQPRPGETVTGITTADGGIAAATHRGSVLVQEGGGWSVVDSLPASDGFAGSYTPLAWLDR